MKVSSTQSNPERDTSRLSDGAQEFLKPLERQSTDAFADLLDSIHCDGFAYSVVSHQSPWQLQADRIDDAIGYYIVMGGAQLTIGADICIELHNGDYAIVAPQLPHRLQSLPSHALTLIGQTTYGLDVARARPLFRGLPPVMVLHGRRSTTAQVHAHTELSRLVAELYNGAEQGNRALMRRLTESSLILSVLTYRHEEELAGHPSAIDPNTLRIAPSLRAMHRHPEKNWTLSMLAKESGLSRSLFCAEFARTTGETPTRYLAQIRLEQARELLRQSNLAIATIASYVGYSDPVTLGRAFKRRFGVSLGAFRSSATGLREN